MRVQQPRIPLRYLQIDPAASRHARFIYSHAGPTKRDTCSFDPLSLSRNATLSERSGVRGSTNVDN